jgi:hypothetical protein
VFGDNITGAEDAAALVLPAVQTYMQNGMASLDSRIIRVTYVENQNGTLVTVQPVPTPAPNTARPTIAPGTTMAPIAPPTPTISPAPTPSPNVSPPSIGAPTQVPASPSPFASSPSKSSGSKVKWWGWVLIVVGALVVCLCGYTILSGSRQSGGGSPSQRRVMPKNSNLNTSDVEDGYEPPITGSAYVPPGIGDFSAAPIIAGGTTELRSVQEGASEGDEEEDEDDEEEDEDEDDEDDDEEEYGEGDDDEEGEEQTYEEEEGTFDEESYYEEETISEKPPGQGSWSAGYSVGSPKRGNSY